MEVDYRTDGRRVVVLPRHAGDGVVVAYEFDGPDRMHPTSVNCDMVRSGGANAGQAAALASAPVQSGPRAASIRAGDAVMIAKLLTLVLEMVEFCA